MADFSLEEMRDMQRALHEKYRHQWAALSPQKGKITFCG